MEADWEFEIGDGAPIIEAAWAGFVDLRRTPERVNELPEVAACPFLAESLVQLNASGSPVWTSKCDFWPEVEQDDFDPDELGSELGRSAHALGCYIDVLPNGDQLWSSPPVASAYCKKLCAGLHAVMLRNCRVDLVIRLASIVPDRTDLAITAYFTAAGENEGLARDTLRAALAAFARVVCSESTLQ